MNPIRTRRGRGLALLAAVSIAAIGVAGCSSSGKADAGTETGASGTTAVSGPKSINVVGFAVLESVYDALSESFAKTAAGKGFSIKGSYGASGDQSKSVANGAKADLVEFSVTPDLTRLVDAKLVAPDWDAGATKGIGSTSVVAFGVRKGNPKNIKTWDDLIKPGIKIVTADPTRSGSAKWNLLGAYAHGLGASKDKAAGEAYLKSFIGNVVSWAESGRKATETFTSGTGDVFITYENEAILAKQAGEDIDYVVPEDSFLIENPIAVTTTAAPIAKQFLDYVLSADGQQVMASKGFRPVDGSAPTEPVEGANDPANPFPVLKKLTTVADLGGWKAVNTLLLNESALVPTLQGS